MKVLILAGGLGSRLSEETSLKPKPMVEIGGRPILWHILKQIFFVELKIVLINLKVTYYHIQTFYFVPARSVYGMVQFLFLSQLRPLTPITSLVLALRCDF